MEIDLSAVISNKGWGQGTVVESFTIVFLTRLSIADSMQCLFSSFRNLGLLAVLSIFFSGVPIILVVLVVAVLFFTAFLAVSKGVIVAVFTRSDVEYSVIFEDCTRGRW
jgi:hypothetical protein